MGILQNAEDKDRAAASLAAGLDPAASAADGLKRDRDENS